LPCTEDIDIQQDTGDVLGLAKDNVNYKPTAEKLQPPTATIEGKNCNGVDNTPKNDPITVTYTATFAHGAAPDSRRVFLVIPKSCDKRPKAWKFEITYTATPGKDPHANISPEVRGTELTKKDIEKLEKAGVL
jgi:hypothetical protein